LSNRMDVGDDLFSRAALAKMDKSTLKLPSVEIEFGHEIDTSQYRLLELNADLLQQIEAGAELFIRGEEDESVVVCTKDVTYDIKLCQTSNQLLLVPDEITPKDSKNDVETMKTTIVKRAQNYLEPKLILPRIDKLYSLLPTVSIERLEDQSSIDDVGLTTDELLEKIQASERQLFDALNHACAIKLKSKWKIIKELDAIVLEIAKVITEESLDINAIGISQLTHTINSAEMLYPDYAILHALKQIGERVSPTSFSINCEKLATLVGRHLLRRCGPRGSLLDDFMIAWEGTMPNDQCCKLSELLTSAYYSEEKGGTSLVFLDPLTLPNEPLRLFERLFRIKKKWTEEELFALTKRITPPNKKSSVIIQKYCRAVTDRGKKLYTIQI